nr:hypothetical protein [Saccharothrix saharensis]
MTRAEPNATAATANRTTGGTGSNRSDRPRTTTDAAAPSPLTARARVTSSGADRPTSRHTTPPKINAAAIRSDMPRSRSCRLRRGRDHPPS